MKVAFLDRDGTISKDYPDAEWTAIRAPELLDGAAEAMRHLMALGYRIIIVTNQYIIGEGFISLAQYESFTQSLLAELRAEGVSVLDVFHCPHRRDSGCDCCKPKVGMIRAACEKYPQIVLAQSFTRETLWRICRWRRHADFAFTASTCHVKTPLAA